MPKSGFAALANELQEIANTAVTAKLNAADLRRVLSFVAKVSNVAEQAFQDVVPVLVEIKYLRPEDINSGRIREIQMQVELLTNRSRYRDAEEICSRLHHLSDQYQEKIAPLLGNVASTHDWRSVFGLIDEHEGRLIHLVYETTWELRNRLDQLDLNSLSNLKIYAAEQLKSVRKTLDQLRDLSNRIYGLSGQEGILELTAGGESQSAVASFFINQGEISMSGDKYEIGQAGAVGPGAQAHDMTFNQIWTKSSGNIDLQQLSNELTALRMALSKQASDPDHFVGLGEVAAAEKAAQQGDGPRALQHLKTAGTWVWDVATKIGIGVATAAAKSALGF